MKKQTREGGRGAAFLPMLLAALLLAACARQGQKASEKATETTQEATDQAETPTAEPEPASEETVTAGTETYRDFTLDNVLHSDAEGDIHYNLYVPDGYDGSEPYALYITLPGYEGLYFQGVGVNIRAEEFAFEAQKYNDRMIIAAPQLEDWGETSADQTIALTEYLLNAYRIDPDKVYINGYSGGGETLSLVLDKRPELYTAALMCSSQWDGGYEAVTQSRTPVYFIIGDSDEYYGAEPFREAYEAIRSRYEQEGLAETDIEELVRLDVKPASYFQAGGVSNQHGGGGALFCRDEAVMGWLFGSHEMQED